MIAAGLATEQLLLLNTIQNPCAVWKRERGLGANLIAKGKRMPVSASTTAFTRRTPLEDAFGAAFGAAFGVAFGAALRAASSGAACLASSDAAIGTSRGWAGAGAGAVCDPAVDAGTGPAASCDPRSMISARLSTSLWRTVPCMGSRQAAAPAHIPALYLRKSSAGTLDIRNIYLSGLSRLRPTQRKSRCCRGQTAQHRAVVPAPTISASPPPEPSTSATASASTTGPQVPAVTAGELNWTLRIKKGRVRPCRPACLRDAMRRLGQNNTLDVGTRHNPVPQISRVSIQSQCSEGITCWKMGDARRNRGVAEVCTEIAGRTDPRSTGWDTGFGEKAREASGRQKRMMNCAISEDISSPVCKNAAWPRPRLMRGFGPGFRRTGRERVRGAAKSL
jgi:hypothetical protein